VFYIIGVCKLLTVPKVTKIIFYINGIKVKSSLYVKTETLKVKSSLYGKTTIWTEPTTLKVKSSLYGKTTIWTRKGSHSPKVSRGKLFDRTSPIHPIYTISPIYPLYPLYPSHKTVKIKANLFVNYSQ